MSDDKPPVRRLASRVALENRVWRVDLDHIVDAGGNEVPEYLVLSPRGHAAGLSEDRLGAAEERPPGRFVRIGGTTAGLSHS